MNHILLLIMAYNKPIIFIDTNSLSHLAPIELKRKKLNTWLWKYFIVHTCNAVKNEFLKGAPNRGSYAKLLARKIVSDKNLVPILKNLNRLEKQWLRIDYYKKNLSKKDEGERHIICTLLEFIHYQNASNVIFVTDDSEAKKSFLNQIKNDFKFGDIWSSTDLILYMYFSFPEITYEFAFSSIRDITSYDSIGFKEFRKREEDEAIARQKMLAYYTGKLKKIKKFRTTIA